jgi:hypothetical protein
MTDKMLKLRKQFQEGKMTAQEYFEESAAERQLYGHNEVLEWFIDETERLVDLNCYFDTRHKIEGPLEELKKFLFEVVEEWNKAAQMGLIGGK